ncbi:LEA type 2 family protein [Oceanospirillum beijerinckii]|uniref:LEA type 2 family protein n=1 Tax=Oceanospirillum beijerinckii TaxID=64976 RepID=UPI00041D8D24|nr:LEA type 2 family protein [Oceanospirillum beijerinckii]
MFKKQAYQLSYLIFFTLFMTGCGNIKSVTDQALQAPEVVSDEIRIDRIDFESLYLIADIELSNPNIIPIRLMPFDYKVNVDGEEFLVGSSKSINIASNANGEVTLPFQIPLKQLLKTVPELFKKDELNYEFIADVTLEGPLGTSWDKTIRTSAAVPTPKLPNIKLPSISVDKMDFYGFRIMVTLPVENKNNFSINLKSLSGALVMDGMKPFQIGSDKSTRLPAKAETEIVIPIELSWDKASRALLPLIQEGRLPEIKLEGNWKLEPELPGFEMQDKVFKYTGKDGMI